ncbi:MAG TPA: alpha-amylase family glycosyl hydrolase [Patescibacteria group bacterium]|nr:alpha-amylase family glycosyl hydrolase [Patescibacteria group bacterium]
MTSQLQEHPDHWWRGAVIYQIYPRSFYDTTGAGTGDLRGIIEKMDYVASLGVDAIWLTPFMKSPMKDFGYDVSDYRTVDPLFGTNEDMDALIAAAHKNGLKVIMDMVVNHTSNEHAWFRESRGSRDNPKADWYIWVDPKEDGTPPNNWLARFGGPGWTYEPRREQFYYHAFSPEQPDLNFRCKEVQDAVLAEFKFWLDHGIDGFRVDACNHFYKDAELRNNPAAERKAGKKIAEPYAMQSHVYDRTRPENLEFLRRIRKLMDAYPERFAVAEVGDDDGIRTSASYVEAPGLLHTAYCFSLLDETPFAAPSFRVPIERFDSFAPHGWPSWSISNHDAIRPTTRWGGKHAKDPPLARMLQALFGCLRGTLFMYQGQELGLTEAKVPYEKMQDPLGIRLYPVVEGRDGSRTPMPWNSQPGRGGFTKNEPWLPIPEDHLNLSVEAQAKTPDSTLAFTRRFLAWRQGHDVLKTGDLRFLDAPDDFLAFRRTGSSGKVVTCIFRLSAEGGVLPKTVFVEEGCHEVVPENQRAMMTGEGLRFPPFGFLIHEA